MRANFALIGEVKGGCELQSNKRGIPERGRLVLDRLEPLRGEKEEEGNPRRRPLQNEEMELSSFLSLSSLLRARRVVCSSEE